MRETMSVTGINSLDPHVIPRTLKRILPPNWCMVRNLAQWIAVCFSLRHHVLISLDDNSSTGDTSNRLPIRTVALSRGVLASVLSSWHKLKLFGKKEPPMRKCLLLILTDRLVRRFLGWWLTWFVYFQLTSLLANLLTQLHYILLLSSNKLI